MMEILSGEENVHCLVYPDNFCSRIAENTLKKDEGVVDRIFKKLIYLSRSPTVWMNFTKNMQKKVITVTHSRIAYTLTRKIYQKIHTMKIINSQNNFFRIRHFVNNWKIFSYIICVSKSYDWWCQEGSVGKREIERETGATQYF